MAKCGQITTIGDVTDTGAGDESARPSSVLQPRTTSPIAGEESPADALHRFLDLETTCARYRVWGMRSVPPPFQTPAYLHGYVSADRMLADGALPGAEAQALAGIQRARRANIIGRAQVTVALGESALLAQIGGPVALQEQTEYLLDLDARNDVDVLIMPFGAGGHRGVHGDFYLLDFPRGSVQTSTLFFESWVHTRCTSDAQLFARVETIFEEIHGRCVPLRTFLEGR
jgi:hypothetical protein